MRIRVRPPGPEKSAEATFEFRFKPAEVEQIVAALGPKGYARSTSEVAWEFRGMVTVDFDPTIDDDGAVGMSVRLTLL